jgi:hypothetical protein
LWCDLRAELAALWLDIIKVLSLREVLKPEISTADEVAAERYLCVTVEPAQG